MRRVRCAEPLLASRPPVSTSLRRAHPRLLIYCIWISVRNLRSPRVRPPDRSLISAGSAADADGRSHAPRSKVAGVCKATASQKSGSVSFKKSVRDRKEQGALGRVTAVASRLKPPDRRERRRQGPLQRFPEFPHRLQ